MNELEIARMMRCDFSVGTEEFRDALLERCLKVLGSEELGIPIEDADLDLIAAAGQYLADHPVSNNHPLSLEP